MGVTFKKRVRTLMFLLLVLLTLMLSGCGDDPKSLVRSSLNLALKLVKFTIKRRMMKRANLQKMLPLLILSKQSQTYLGKMVQYILNIFMKPSLTCSST